MGCFWEEEGEKKKRDRLHTIMRLQYFGTAAADAIPTPFCNCEICRKSKQLGGRNIRTRSQALLNEDLLIDFNPDTVAHFLTYGVEWNQIDNCLITHSHADHLYVSDIIISRFSTNPHTVHYFSGKAGYELINRELNSSQIMRSENRADVTLVLPMIEFHAGGYDILPLPADHDPASSPLLYAIKRDGKKILYAHDTGLFPEETVQRLKSFGKLDLISLDCTGALAMPAWREGHMSLLSNIEMVERLTKEGIVDESTIKILNHFSHNGLATYDEIVKQAKPYGFLVSYDGMTVEF